LCLRGDLQGKEVGRHRRVRSRPWQAVAEIRKVARTDPALAAEGAVAFLERVSPALEILADLVKTTPGEETGAQGHPLTFDRKEA
jgi:hypothetical protein